MTKVVLSRNFIKNFKKRIKTNKSLADQYGKRVDIFLRDRSSPILKDHKLVGKKGDFRAFSITGDIRVVYRILEDHYRFEDIGTHNQVYE